MLLNKQSKRDIPLKSLKVVGDLVDAIAQVTVEQVYHNAEDTAIEAVFKV